MLRELLVGVGSAVLISAQVLFPSYAYAAPGTVQQGGEVQFEALVNEFDSEYHKPILASLKPDGTVIENADEFLVGLRELPEDNYFFLIETIPEQGITDSELDFIGKLSEVQRENPELFSEYYNKDTLEFLVNFWGNGLAGDFLELEFPAEYISLLPADAGTLASLIEEDEDIKIFFLDREGKIPVLMYHHIGYGSNYYVTPEGFRKQLQVLYDNGFSLISVEDFVNKDFSGIPNGRKPLILTFDDGWRDQMNYINGEIDPNCAVGILNEFYKTNPDFNFEAIFFVSFDKTPFGQREYVGQKMNQMLDMGLEIGNHTNTHAFLSKLGDEGVKSEMDLAMAKFDYYLGPRVSHVATFAYPYGAVPANLDIITNYEYKGTKLTAAFDAWGGLTPNPFNENYDTIRIKRISADDYYVNMVAKNTGCMIIRYQEINVSRIYLVSEDVFLDYMTDKTGDFEDGMYYYNDYFFTIKDGGIVFD